MNGLRPSTPFGDEYREMRSPAVLERERTAINRQVADLVAHSDPEFTLEFAGQLQERRAGTAAVQVDTIESGEGVQVLVARRSFLVRRSAGFDRQDRLPDEFGLVVADDTGGLTRLEEAPVLSAAARRPSTAELLQRLRDSGIDADLNHIVPLGGVIMKAHGGQEPSAGARPFPAVPIPPSGDAPLVAVIDTGISLERRTDGYLQNLLEPDNLDALDILPFPGRDGLLDAAAGHGSFVAGVVQQVAPGARLRVYKVTDSEGICTDQQVAAAIRRATADGAQIINLSLGTPTAEGSPPPAMLAAIQEVPPEVLIVCAAGNDGTEVEMWPAAFATTFRNVVAVAGLDPDGQPSAYSSRGSWITCSAIGQGVVSTYVVGTEDGATSGDSAPDTFPANSWATGVGTSFAAPQITGGVARLVHEKGLSPADALAELLADAPDELAGWGKRVQILPGT